jgi:dTDP-4-dehydrorhamnose reductase
MAEKKEKFLVFGGTGFLGPRVVALLEQAGEDYVLTKNRLQNRESVEKELDEVKPTRVLNIAGVTGRPNVDWCETNKEDTILVNVVGTISLVDACWRRGIHVTNFATGCIYSYDAEHALGSGKGFTEEDKPNFGGSFYSHTKGMVEDLLMNYKNLLQLRVRMPLSDDLNPRNFITKISRYERVVNIPNSMTVLHDLLPVSIEMSKKELTGIYNFTNPGVVSHNQCLDLYIKYIDPNFKYTNFTEEEQAKVIKAARSNNELDTTKLEKEFPDIPRMPEAMEALFVRMKANLEKDPNCTFSL